ncbi:MAG: alpha/beta hydrolase [Spirochaetes bacterium]|nr:alpha/beta hydrolase [Spirochaetota bacterium]
MPEPARPLKTTLPPQFMEGEEQRFIDLKGIRLSYKVSGDGPPLVFHHGWIGNEDTFAMCHQAFARYFTVYRPAWPGYGDSSPLNKFSIEDLVELSREFITLLGLRRPVMVGNCLGGNVVMEFARVYPRLLSRLVLVEIYEFFPEVYRLLLVPGISWILYHLLFKTRTGFNLLNNYMPLQMTNGNNGWEYTWEGFTRTHTKSALRFLKAIYVYSKNFGKYKEKYRSDVPAIYVSGGKTFGPAATFGAIVDDLFSNLSVVSIPESQHNPVVERPELFQERVLEALGFDAPTVLMGK